MTNETKQRIKYYQEALPNMKAKVASAAMMLMIAVCVTITASYAWMTLSTAPEVTSIDTSVAANGNLEIALANGTGDTPGKAKAGDSTGAGTAITAANITWGNLVNLSDPSYGLANITLRPAALNGTTGLLTNPLYGVGYGEDGRVSSMVTDYDFAYVYYDTEIEKFMADLNGDHLGVRAISTVKYENLGGDEKIVELTKYASGEYKSARENYGNMTNESSDPGKSYIASLEGLIELYAQNIIDQRADSSKTLSTLNVKDYVEALYDMMQYCQDNVMEHTGQTYVYLIDLMKLLKTGSAGAQYTVDSLVTSVRAGTLQTEAPYLYYQGQDGKTYCYLTGLKQFADDYYQLTVYLKDSETGEFDDLTDTEKADSLAYWAYRAGKGDAVYWTDIEDHIDWICNINTAKLDGYTLSALSSASVASKVLFSSPHEAIIYGGALYRIEKLLGVTMSPEITVNVDASPMAEALGYGGMGGMLKSIDITATLHTNAHYELETETCTMDADTEAITSQYTGSLIGTDAVAEDTYAMAIDLWVRTNAGTDGTTVLETKTETGTDGSTTVTTTTSGQVYLTLEGSVLMGTEEVQVMVEDINGEEQPAYTASYTVDETLYTQTVYLRYGTYYYIKTEEGKEAEEIDFAAEIAQTYESDVEISYAQKITQQDVVIGYEGVNRVWNEDQMEGYAAEYGTSTTQGSGSCYVFYASTPADQSRFLELLQSMKVVFVNADGRMIGTASMDTEHYYAQTGKVTVPLVLDKSKATDLGTDADGNKIYGMTTLTKNAATRITALIYLDGTKLTNDMVLASGDIQGNLNIQFGSSVAHKSVSVTTDADGVVTNTTTTYKQGIGSVAIKDDKVMSQIIEVSAKIDKDEFDYDPDNAAQTTLTVKVDGAEVGTVEARFIRAISSTQGVLQSPVTLTRVNGSDTDWSATVTFAQAGNYVLRSVWVDGVEYSLDAPVEVTVRGNTVSSVTFDDIKLTNNRATKLTAGSSFSTGMTLAFTSSEDLPDTVNGLFMDEQGRQVNVPFTLQDSQWKGTASFISSGTYTMMYVEIDGAIYELDESIQPTLEVMLGLKARTWVSATADILKLLEADMDDASATNFIYNPPYTVSSGDANTQIKVIPLQVEVEIYDNSGNELIGLGDVTLTYGQVGSSVRNLYSPVAWDSGVGRYEGEFGVSMAGLYKFKNVAVTVNGETSYIETYTSAPNIQARPAGDVEYAANHTDDNVQYALASPKFAVGLLNSSAAGSVQATVVSPTGVKYDVAGAANYGLADVTLQDGETPWVFTLPKTLVEDDTYEGTWQLTTIKVSGVYYNETYYEYDDQDPSKCQYVTLNLTSEKIEAKVFKDLTVTLNVGDTILGDEEESYFMTVPAAQNVSVAFSDVNGESVKSLIDSGAIKISDVYVYYYLNMEDAVSGDYDYTGTFGKTSIIVNAAGVADTSDSSKYQVDGLQFAYAGPYDQCMITYKITGSSGSTSISLSSATEDSLLRYTVNGTSQDIVPVYHVYWKNLPIVTIEGTSPAGATADDMTAGEAFYVFAGGSDKSKVEHTKNYYEDYYANVHMKAGVKIDTYSGTQWNGNYEVPTVTFKLENVEGKVNTENKARITISNSTNATYSTSAVFTENGGTDICEVGGVVDGGWGDDTCYNVGQVSISTISMEYEDGTFVVDLSDPIIIRQVSEDVPTLTYVIPDDYKVYYTAPTYVYNGKSTVVAPALTNKTVTWSVQSDSVTTGTLEMVAGTQELLLRTTSTIKTTYWYYTYAEYTRTDSASVQNYEAEIAFIGWSIGDTIYGAGEEIPVSGDMTATAVFTRTLADEPFDTGRAEKTYTYNMYTLDEKGMNIGWDRPHPRAGYKSMSDEQVSKVAQLESEGDSYQEITNETAWVIVTD